MVSINNNSNNKLFFFVLFSITILAAFIRFNWLTHHGIWMDEGYNINYSLPNLTLSKVIWGSVVRNGFPPADLLLQHYIMRLFGVTEWSVKLLPALTGIFGVFFLGLLGKRLANWRVGVIAALLLALSPFHIYFSLEVRPYAHICFAAIIYSYAFIRYIQKDSVLNALFLALTLIYGFCVTIFFLFVSATVAFSFVISYVFIKKYRFSVFKSCVIHLLCGLPVYFIYSKIGIIDEFIYNAPPTPPKTFSVTLNLHSNLYILSSFFHGKSYLSNSDFFYYVLGFLWIVMLLYKKWKNYQLKILSNMFIIIIPIIAWLFSKMGCGKTLLGRYVIYVLPFIILGLSYGIEGGANWLLLIIPGNKKFRFQRFSLLLSFIAALSFFYFISFKPLKTIYTRVYKSPYQTIEKKLKKIAHKNPVIVISTVKYDLGGAICFSYFYDITNAQYKVLPSGSPNVNPKTLAPYIHDIVFEDAKVVYIINKGKWNVDKTLFDLWNPNKGFPAVDVWIQKDLPSVIPENMMNRYCKYFGNEFRKLRKFNVNNFFENNSNATKNLSIKMADIPNLITSNLFKPLTKNVDCRDEKVIINNSICDNILGTLPPQFGWGGITYYTSNNFTRFSSSVLNISGQAIFLIKGDGKQIARVGEKDANKAPRNIDLDITGINKLELLVNGFGYNKNDNPVWISPTLTPTLNYIYLTNLKNITSSNLYLPLAFNKTWNDEYVFVNNTLYKHPVLVHPPLNGLAYIKVPLNSKYLKFISKIGVLKNGGLAKCKVYVDNQLCYNSGLLTNINNADVIDLDISNAKELVLVFDACGNNFFDQIALLDPILIKKNNSLILQKKKKKSRILQEDKGINSIIKTNFTKYTSLLNFAPVTNYVNYKIDSISVDNIPYRDVIVLEPVSKTANAELKYKLSRKYKRFQTTVWNANKKSTVLFFGKGDGKMIFNTGIFNGNMSPKQINIDISGINMLELYVHPFGYYPNDKVIIVDPKLIK